MATIFVIPHCKQLFIVPWMRKTLLSGDTAHLVLREKGGRERERQTEIEGKKEMVREIGGGDERQTRRIIFFYVRVSDIERVRQVFKWIPTVQGLKRKRGGGLCRKKKQKQISGFLFPVFTKGFYVIALILTMQERYRCPHWLDG